MFAISHSTRIFWCRTGFVLFCLIPTMLVAGWMIRRSRPEFIAAERTEWQRELSRRMGLSVTIGALSYPNYYTARLDDVQLANGETNRIVARIRTLDIARSSSGWIVETSQPEIDLQALSLVTTVLHDRLFRAVATPGTDSAACQFTARELTLRSGARALTLSDVAALRESTQDGLRLIVNFHLAGQPPAAENSQLSICRSLQQSPPATRWELKTDASPLPCSLLAELLPALQGLGSDATFHGQAWCTTSKRGLSGEVSGTLDRVELDRLVSDRFPHQLSGLARLQLTPARIQAGRLNALRGTLQAANGRISASLLQSATQHLALDADSSVTALPAGQALPFRHLSVGFQLDDTGLSLTGSADPTRDGVLLASAAGVLLEAPPQHRVTAIALIRTLAPESQLQVPATMQTDLLIRTLPLPSIVPTQTATREIGHLPTRLAPPGGFDASRAIRESNLK